MLSILLVTDRGVWMDCSHDRILVPEVFPNFVSGDLIAQENEVTDRHPERPSSEKMTSKRRYGPFVKYALVLSPFSPYSRTSRSI